MCSIYRLVLPSHFPSLESDFSRSSFLSALRFVTDARLVFYFTCFDLVLGHYFPQDLCLANTAIQEISLLARTPSVSFVKMVFSLFSFPILISDAFDFPIITPCNHVFHRDCLVRWMEVKLDCPVCRSSLPFDPVLTDISSL